MNWHDILLKQCFDEITLKRAFADVFGIPLHDVGIVTSIEDTCQIFSILIVKIPVKGDFHCLLSVYTTDEKFSAMQPYDVIPKIISKLGTQALISDSSSNPYSMILVNEMQELQPIFLDIESLDLHEEYKISEDE